MIVPCASTSVSEAIMMRRVGCVAISAVDSSTLSAFETLKRVTTCAVDSYEKGVSSMSAGMISNGGIFKLCFDASQDS